MKNDEYNLKCPHCHAHFNESNKTFTNVPLLKAEDDYFTVKCLECEHNFRVIMKIVTEVI